MASILENCIVSLPVGQIKGVKKLTVYDEEYFSFEGIPYGKPPLGELRFKSPLPADGWDGIKDCTTFSSKPVQKNMSLGTTEGSEDCLYLNVYVKKLESDKRLPVLVWIYGGGFNMGEATSDIYSPDYFMHEDVILVTFNYRLCSLGFLRLCDPQLQIPGNAALKDQVLALKWVKQYISYLNGDTNNITLFGDSAGGCSVHYMMITEQTRGLFHKAILMSGSVLNYWGCLPQTDMAFRLAKYHGYDGDDKDVDVLLFLQMLEPTHLVNHNLLTDEDLKMGFLLPFGPTIEAYINKDCVVPTLPKEMLQTAWSNDIPIIIGGTSFEGLFMYPRLKLYPHIMNAVRNEPQCIVPYDVARIHSEEENKRMGYKLIELHFGSKEPNEKCIYEFMDLYSYKAFWHGIHRAVLARLRYARTPTYLYRFDFDSSDFNQYRKKFCGSDIKQGVAHGDDLSYIFFSKFAWKLNQDSDEFKTIRSMISIITCFAKKSNPNCKEIAPVIWTPVTASDPYKALNINIEINIISIPEKCKLEHWHSLYNVKDLC